jgi:hypothetical protein
MRFVCSLRPFEAVATYCRRGPIASLVEMHVRYERGRGRCSPPVTPVDHQNRLQRELRLWLNNYNAPLEHRGS